MPRRSKNWHASPREAGGLFGEPVVEPLGHLSARYPFPAHLNEAYVARLKASNVGKSYSKGAILYEEGDKPTGVYVVLEGRAKLTVNSSRGKTLLLGFFGPGTILGLASAILARIHAATAEIMIPTKVLFVSRKELVREMEGDAMAARHAAELVSEACYFILTKMRDVELSESTGQRLARCLLGLLAHNADSGGEAALQLDLSQETIAQMIGLSRETVTRLMSRFRTKHIVDWKRSGLVIQNRKALERLADFSETGTSFARDVAARRAPSARSELRPGSTN
ncbi:MAG: Crp/Fnr family transcriptional regulator [Candidatus Acidiferrales bacterium]